MTELMGWAQSGATEKGEEQFPGPIHCLLPHRHSWLLGAPAGRWMLVFPERQEICDGAPCCGRGIIISNNCLGYLVSFKARGLLTAAKYLGLIWEGFFFFLFNLLLMSDCMAENSALLKDYSARQKGVFSSCFLSMYQQ